MPLRRRTDGTPVANLHPVRRIMPFIMPTRAESVVMFEQQVDVEPARRLLARLNADRAPERAVTLFHVILYALGRALDEFPRLNRFVAGSRLYDRSGIWLAFSAKTALERDAPIFTAKIEFRPAEALEAFADRLLGLIRGVRIQRETPTEREVKPFLKLPAPLLRLGTRLVRWLDGRNLLPARFIAEDSLFASVFVANLGSVGLDAAFHHLYEYGTIPIFVTVGQVGPRPVVLSDGHVGARDVFALRYTYDERIEDGFYAARALERVAAFLGAPS
jgi:hypothetical protein